MDNKTYICKYCGKVFDNPYKLGGHITRCKLNPNYEINKIKCKNFKCNFKGTQNKEKKLYICLYCGKEVGNKGCLVMHEQRCKSNPNYIPTNKQQERINKKLNKQPRKYDDTFKEKISKARKKWLSENKDKHVWKRHTKFISTPCENVKKFLIENKISFVSEYSPFDDFHYAIDIAFPNKKIGIEINGNQHYNKNGELTEYYQKRHDLFIERGWNLIEIHYSLCFNTSNKFFNDLLNLDIHSDDYSELIKEIFLTKEFNKSKKQEQILKLKKEKYKKENDENNKRRNILINAINKVNRDYKKIGWNSKLYKYLEENNNLFNKHILTILKKYYPEFFVIYNPFIRKRPDNA